MSDAPVSHFNEALKLSADTTCDLFEAVLNNGTTIRFWTGQTVTWQGNQYESLACQLTGEQRNSDGSYARPTLTVVNPDNAFGVFAAEGYFDLAVVTRKRVLQQDLINNIPAFEPRIWLVGKPSRVTRQVLQLELRDTTDIPVWQTPRRTFNPPTFPFVVL